MNDTLLEEIKAAFRSRKLQPIRRLFFLNDESGDFACPLVALAIHRGQVDRSDPGIEIDGGANTALEWAAQTFGEDFAIGLLDGFDGQEQAKADPQYLRGYDLGVAAAQQLSPRDPGLNCTKNTGNPNSPLTGVIMVDPTENIRRERLVEINAAPGSRQALEAQYGQVWDTQQLGDDFEVIGFMAPLVVVRRKSDGVKGSLEFQHQPRFYFNFAPYTK